MFDTFTVVRRSGLVASLDADRMAPDFGAGAEADGAADGSHPSHDDANFDDGDGTDTDADAARAAADNDDDEEFDTEDEQDKPLEERFKKLTNALRKAKRKLGSSRSDRQFLKELKDRGISVQDLYADSREYRRFLAETEKNPRLKSLLASGGGEGDDAPRGKSTTSERRSAADTDDFQFDDSPDALGFDPKESPANKVLAQGLRDVAQLKHQLSRILSHLGDPKELVSKVRTIDTTLRSSQQRSVDGEWNTAYAAAAKHIQDPELKAVFGDLLLAAKEKYGGQRPAQFFVDHYLKKLKVNPQQAARASAAAGQARARTAERVTQLSRPTGQNGTPAPARQKSERLADVHKRVRNLAGLGTPR
jgi:hypothetical protein